MRYTMQELADKVAWEGGIYEAIQGYGIGVSEVPEEIEEDWQRAVNAAKVLAEVAARLPEAEEA